MQSTPLVNHLWVANQVPGVALATPMAPPLTPNNSRTFVPQYSHPFELRGFVYPTKCYRIFLSLHVTGCAEARLTAQQTQTHRSELLPFFPTHSLESFKIFLLHFKSATKKAYTAGFDNILFFLELPKAFKVLVVRAKQYAEKGFTPGYVPISQ